jgi:hypothetical protein
MPHHRLPLLPLPYILASNISLLAVVQPEKAFTSKAVYGVSLDDSSWSKLAFGKDDDVDCIILMEDSIWVKSYKLPDRPDSSAR